jgi:hypothetical protein
LTAISASHTKEAPTNQSLRDTSCPLWFMIFLLQRQTDRLPNAHRITYPEDVWQTAFGSNNKAPIHDQGCVVSPIFHRRNVSRVTSDLALNFRKADHGQGISGARNYHRTHRKFFVIKVLTSNSLALKILQTLFAEPAPVKAFRGGGGEGVPQTRHFSPSGTC